MIFDKIENVELYTNYSEPLKQALRYMMDHDLNEMEPGRYNLDGSDVTVIIKKGYETKEKEKCRWESHKKFIDIQYLLKGKERIGVCDAKIMAVKTPYDEQSDKTLYESHENHFEVKLTPGTYVILFPDDAHMPLIQDGEAAHNDKAVLKIRIAE